MGRAQISVQFTWIFAIIAGVAVLAFILVFINTQKAESELSTSITVLQHIDTELRAVAKTPSTFNRIETPMVKLKVLCQDMETSGLALAGAETTMGTPFQVIFSHETLEGRDFLAWTQDWELSTNVDRFLYLSNPEVAFVIVKDEPVEKYWRDFNESLPRDFPRDIVSYNDVFFPGSTYQDRGYEQYRIVFFNQLENKITSIERNDQLSDLRGKRVTALNFKPETDSLGRSGEADFYVLGPDALVKDLTTYYIGMPLVYGAAFAESAEHYSCNLEKSFFKTKLHANLSRNSTVRIMQELAHGREDCQGWLPNAPAGSVRNATCPECLKLMEELPGLYEQIIEHARPVLGHMEDLGLAAMEIDSIRNDLRRGRDCPAI